MHVPTPKARALIALALTVLACAGGGVDRVGSLIAERAEGVERGTLMIASERLTDDELARILAHPEMADLADIALHHNALTAAAIPALVASPRIAGVQRLDLSYNPLGDAGVTALAASPVLARLTALSVAGAGATEAGIRALAASPHAARIAELDVGYQVVGAAAADLVQPRTVLRLREAGVDGPTAARLLNRAHVATIELSGNPIGSVSGRLATEITTIDLSGCEITRFDAAGPGLRALDLDRNPLGEAGIRAIAAAPWLADLQYLSVMGTDASPAARQALRDAWGERPGLTAER